MICMCSQATSHGHHHGALPAAPPHNTHSPALYPPLAIMIGTHSTVVMLAQQCVAEQCVSSLLEADPLCLCVAPVQRRPRRHSSTGATSFVRPANVNTFLVVRKRNSFTGASFVRFSRPNQKVAHPSRFVATLDTTLSPQFLHSSKPKPKHNRQTHTHTAA